MPKLPGFGQNDAIRGLMRLGFVITRQSKHIILEKGDVAISIPRHRSINAYTMGNIAKDAGCTPEEFRKLI